jgi:hypothetical protein
MDKIIPTLERIFDFLLLLASPDRWRRNVRRTFLITIPISGPIWIVYVLVLAMFVVGTEFVKSVASLVKALWK